MRKSYFISLLASVLGILALLDIFALPYIVRLRPRWNVPWYDWAVHGIYPTQSYHSFDHLSPWVNKDRWSTQCDPGSIFLTPRGPAVRDSDGGPVILDAQGELVWMEPSWKTTMDFRVQEYRGNNYLTFWAGLDTHTHGKGNYYMVRLQF